jgi:uncharacterized protein
MFEVDIRELRRGPVDTIGTLAADDPALEGLGLDLSGPVAVDGQLKETSDGEYFWRATVAGAVRSECRRCLTEITIPVDIDVNVLFSTDPEAADDPSVYPLDEASRTVDVRPAVREELALMAPAFSLCRDDCAGLCPRCGADLNAGPCSCT